jgi:hypothetical protein
MGQLTNLYVSQSYQGLLKMTNSATGVTTSLQTVQTGDGADTPLQISQTQVNISGSLTVNGGPISVDTGSLVTTSSFNAYTGSNDARVNSLIAATGSYVTETESGSFVTSVTGSSATVTVTKGNGTTNQFTINNVQSSSFATNSTSASFAQNALSASYAPSSVLPSGVVSGSAQISALGFAITGSNNFVGDQFVSGGVYISGSGELRKKGGTFNVQNDAGTNYFTVNTAAGLSEVTVPFNATSGITVTGSVNIQGNISATSASFTYVTTTYETASVIYSSGSNQFGDASNDTQTLYGTVRLPNGPLNVTGSALFSGSVGIWSGSYLETDGITNFGPGEDIEIAPKSAADVIVNLTNSTDKFIVKGQSIPFQTLMEVTGSLSVTNGITGSLLGTASYALNAATASYFNGTVASASYAVNADTASIARDVIVVGKCNNGGGLTRGTVVRIVGANGDNPLFDSASWTDETNSANVLGMLSEDVAFNGFANVVVLGKVLGLNTNAYTPSTNLYLSSSGQFTSTVPTAPSQSVRLGQVLRQNVNNGSIYFRADNGYELGELHNVIDTANTTGELLSFVSGSYGLWVNKTSSQLGLATSSSVNLATGSLLKTGSVAGNVLTFTKGDGTTFDLTVATGSGSDRNGLITTGSIAGTQAITGSLISSGSIATTGSVTVGGDLYNLSQNGLSSVSPYLFLTSSQAGQVNFIKGWSDNPTAGGAGAVIANYTGSLRITGSNNTVSLPQIRATGFGGGSDLQGYISGSDNIIGGNFAGIYLNTGSLLFPKIWGNNVQPNSALVMNFTTSSLSGGHPTILNNTLYAGTITVNSNSGSIQAMSSNIVNGGSVTTTQNFVTNTRPTISTNLVNGQNVTLNHISSSVNYSSNFNNSPITVNNHLSSSNITNNSVTVNNNIIVGGSQATGHVIYVSGSQSSNASRQFSDNIIGGKNVVVSSSFVSSSASNLYATIVYGNTLTVSGSHSGNGGSAFFGRFNDTGSLHLAQDIVFAVGTGTAAGSRRTGLYVTSGSLVGVSGSLNVIGSVGAVSVTGSMILSSSAAVGMDIQTFSTNHTGALFISSSGLVSLDVKGYNTNISSSLNLTGSLVQTGSLQQNVVTLTNSSNTASLDLSQGNFFSYVLADSSANYLNPTNVKPGMRFTVKAIGTGPSSQIEINSAKFAGGPGLVSVGTSGSYRIFDFVSYDNSKPTYLQQFGLF